MKRSIGWTSLLLMGLLAGCGGGRVDTSIPLDEARVLNSEVTSVLVRAQSLLESTTVTTRELAYLPDGIAPDDFDVDMTREVLAACFTDPIAYPPETDLTNVPRSAEAEMGPEHRPLTERPPVGRALPCEPARMHALESYVTSARPEVREYLTDRVLTVDALRVNLNDVLVAQLDRLEDVSTSVRAEAERLRGVSEERRALSQAGTQDELERRQNEVDYDEILTEFDQIAAVLDQIDAGLADMRQLRRQLIEEATRNIAGIAASAD